MTHNGVLVMKKRMMRFLCAVLCLALTASFCGCGMLKTIRENANRPILDSPAEDSLAEFFNTALENTRAAAVDGSETVTLEIGRPSLEPEAESKAASILGTAADTLKKIIMEQKPGSSERDLKSDAAEDTLLRAVDAADVLAKVVRNEISMPVTDENDEQLTDEDGNLLTENKISDNILILTLSFGGAEEAAGDGEDAPASPPDKAVVEKYFGKGADDAAVREELQKVAAYLQLDDYTVDYTSCGINAEIDLERTVLHAVTYEKHFTVTAHLTGVGSFEELGAVTVTFDGTVRTDYTFDFSVDE